jgi:very-short-patch-repair endonuclease
MSDEFKPISEGYIQLLQTACRNYCDEPDIPPETWRDSAWVHAFNKDFLEGRNSKLNDIMDLLESPLEHAAFVYLEGLEYPLPFVVGRPDDKPDIPCIFVQPQFKVGRYRLDFLFTIVLSDEKSIKLALELDGQEFHTNKEKDDERDEWLALECSIFTRRIPGKHIFGNLEWAFRDFAKELNDYAELKVWYGDE